MLSKSSSQHDLTGKIMVIDLSYLIHRSYKTSNNPESFPHPDAASNITLKTINRLKFELNPREVVVALESGHDHRTAIIEDYKNREEKDGLLVEEIDKAIELAMQAGCVAAYAENLEADDVMATYGVQHGLDCIIVTSDKDLHQLAGVCHLYDPYKRGVVTEEGVFERWGVSPHQLGDMLAMNGDKADCIPGIPKIGPKTAAALLKEHRTLHGILAVAEQMAEETGKKVWRSIADHQDHARKSRSVVQLITNAEIKFATEEHMPWSESRTRLTNQT
jgi:DNA polymerase I